MKHGPLALVSKDVPVVAILTKNQLYEKMKSSIQEVRARGARTLIIATEGEKKPARLPDDIILCQNHGTSGAVANYNSFTIIRVSLSGSLGRDVIVQEFGEECDGGIKKLRSGSKDLLVEMPRSARNDAGSLELDPRLLPR